MRYTVYAEEEMKRSLKIVRYAELVKVQNRSVRDKVNNAVRNVSHVVALTQISGNVDNQV